MFIAIEGVDGVGKTTVARLLAVPSIAGYITGGRCVQDDY